MTAGRNQVLRVGDRVRFEDDEWSVTGHDGTRVRLADDIGRAQLLLAGHLLTSPGFRLFGADPAARCLDPVGLLDALPCGCRKVRPCWSACIPIFGAGHDQLLPCPLAHRHW